MVDHNLAIEALKKEVDTLEAEKTRLEGRLVASALPKLTWRICGRMLIH